MTTETAKGAAMDCKVRFWGVRGSVPTPGPTTASVGGNTSCVEVRAGEEVIILDAGTGLRRLGEHLRARRDELRASILFSHVHWDHIQGLPFFAPVFHPTTELALYGSPEHERLEDALTRQMTGPNFPVPFEALPSALSFHAVQSDEPFSIGPARITPRLLNHPNGVYAYRIDVGDRSLVYATDTEHYPDRLDHDLVELSGDADMLIYDAMYTPDDYPQRIGWGHSTWVEAVKVARAANVSTLVLFHHDPASDDARVATIERQAAAAFPGALAAREGLVLTVGGGGTIAEAA
jgi:phosphoribosyl 1,2-cyclic phosphodiesterase